VKPRDAALLPIQSRIATVTWTTIRRALRIGRAAALWVLSLEAIPYS
jgi:hypothetical protein